MRNVGHIYLGAALLLLSLVGCKAAPVQGDLHAVDAESRIPGIVAAERSQDPAELRELVAGLYDDDAAVRLFSAEALRRRTGEDFGYRAYAPDAEREAAAGRWAAYLDASLTAADPAP